MPSTSKKSTPKVKFVKKPGHEVAKKKTTAMPKRKTTSSNATKKCSSKNTKANTEIPPKQTKEEVEVEVRKLIKVDKSKFLHGLQQYVLINSLTTQWIAKKVYVSHFFFNIFSQNVVNDKFV